jgi:hypothetical protein
MLRIYAVSLTNKQPSPKISGILNRALGADHEKQSVRSMPGRKNVRSPSEKYTLRNFTADDSMFDRTDEMRIEIEREQKKFQSKKDSEKKNQIDGMKSRTNPLHERVNPPIKCHSPVDENERFALVDDYEDPIPLRDATPERLSFEYNFHNLQNSKSSARGQRSAPPTSRRFE